MVGAFLEVSREDWACLALIVLGIILFLYGANYYDAFVGYFGIFLFVGGLIALIALYIYNWLTKPNPEPQSEAQSKAQVPGEVQNP